MRMTRTATTRPTRQRGPSKALRLSKIPPLTSRLRAMVSLLQPVSCPAPDTCDPFQAAGLSLFCPPFLPPPPPPSLSYCVYVCVCVCLKLHGDVNLCTVEKPKEETPEERKKRKKKEKQRKKKLAAANKGPSALHRACEKGHSDAACALVDLGADVNCLMNDLNTPLHLAVLSSRQDTVMPLRVPRAGWWAGA